MVSVNLVFMPPLVRLLQEKKGGASRKLDYYGKRPLKDIIESLGVPHTEVGETRVNGLPVPLDHIPGNGDNIEVLPHQPPQHPDTCRFLCDIHLKTLARRLRLLGQYCAFEPQLEDPGLAELSNRHNLILLTRDRGLLKRNLVEKGMYVHNTDPEKQVAEVLGRYSLWEQLQPFGRCIRCNGKLLEADTTSSIFQQQLKPRIPQGVLKRTEHFMYCPDCLKAYWKGAHFDKLTAFIEKYRQQEHAVRPVSENHGENDG